MKNQILILALALFVVTISAQQPVPNSNSGKGVSPLQLQTASSTSSLQHNWKLPTSTYVIVIGISDHQDPPIPNLRFADKDKERSKNILVSKIATTAEPRKIYSFEDYTPDTIISFSNRVLAKQSIQFKIWAMQRLKNLFRLIKIEW